MKVAIIGSRTITELEIESFIPKGVTMILTGGANGVDRIAERYADRKRIKKQLFLPDYERYGKSAPLIRNKLIVDNADILIAIWDGESSGTLYTINYAKSIGKQHEVYLIN